MGKAARKAQKTEPRSPDRTRVALYTRISTDEAHQPYSLGAQTDRLRSYVKSQENWSVWRVYEDQMTGTVLERPGLQSALEAARKGFFDLLLVFRVDRLARSVRSLAAILEELDGYEVAFRSATEPFDTASPAGRMMVQMLGVFAEFERATLIERVVAGMERKAAGGGWNGRRPLGYDYDSETGGLKVNVGEASIVNEIFDLYVGQRFGVVSIARWLNKNGYRNRDGNLWKQNAVHGVLTNRAYLGEVLWKDRSYDGKHAAIVKQAVFEEAQHLLKVRGEDSSRRRSNTTDYVLTGVLRCGKCNRPFAGTAANGNGGKYRYYTCRSRLEYGPDKCDMERMRAESTEDKLIAYVHGTLANERLLRDALERYRSEIGDGNPKREGEINRLEKEARKLRSSLDRYLEAFESGKMPAEACAPRVEELHTRLSEIDTRTDSLKIELETDLWVPDLEEVKVMAEELRDMMATLQTKDLPKFKEILRVVLPSATVESRLAIRPEIHLPLVRITSTKVGATGFEPVTPAL